VSTELFLQVLVSKFLKIIYSHRIKIKIHTVQIRNPNRGTKSGEAAGPTKEKMGNVAASSQPLGRRK
jgi:hypothetical protein